MGGDISYAERPESGIENFGVNVNYYNDFINGVKDELEAGSLIYEDRAVIALPDNYSPSGSAIRLIIHCGGTGERITSGTNPLTQDFHGWKYFLSKGYAVLDANGLAENYRSNIRGSSATINHFGCKYLLQSYKKAYDYVINKYNIAKDGCFITGISMGGLSSTMLVQSGMFPVIAHGAFSPVTEIFKQSFVHGWRHDNASSTAVDFGFDSKSDSETNIDWFKRNIDKIIGWDSHIKNTFGDKTNLWNYFDGENEKAVYDGLTKFYPCPLKVWHAIDDTTVWYRYSKYLVEMIRRGGGTAELHLYSSGGHTAAWGNRPFVDPENNFSTFEGFYECIKFFEKYSY